MGEITQVEYDAVVADLKQYKSFLDQARLHIASLVAEKNSLVSRNSRLRKALDDVFELITAQRAGEALPLIADVLGQDTYAD
jgi:hypothetical protein